MAKVPKSEQPVEIKIPQIASKTIPFWIIGRTPLIMNRMASKAKRQLLMPSPRMNAADKAANLKHDPLAEYRDAAYRHFREDAPTRLQMPANAFKKALSDAAIDIPGAAKAQIGRLSQVVGVNVAIYGAPKILASVVRNSDIRHTPDIRFRPIIERWCAVVDVSYVTPLVNMHSVAALVSAAGMIRGIGDWRVEKGSADYGQWQIVNEGDKEWQAIAEMGTAAQDAALENPEYYDDETQELIEWYNQEILRRRDAPPPVKKTRAKKDQEAIQ
jgi:hypothetical protein